MEYKGKFDIFDFSRIETYPIATRPNKFKAKDMIRLDEVLAADLKFDSPELRAVAKAVLEARAGGKPVIWMMGAHPVKLGLSPIVIELIERGLVTLVACNCAATIHDFELALMAETSESVPNALPAGKFGMAYETGKYMNDALAHGNSLAVGFGESLARMILGEAFPYQVEFPHQGLSFVARGYQKGVPVTVHATMGTDIIDQHSNFDGRAKGGCSGRDFGIYCAEVEKMTEGGVVLNVGSAVTGPEVLLKTVSMVSNVGAPCHGIITGDFDMRPADFDEARDETKPTYYFRDIKSVVTRIPEAFGGQGYYVRGLFEETVPSLYRLLVRHR